MQANLDQIKNIVVVMMENRSFDHMLGYLSLPPFNRTDVNGLSADPGWLNRYANQDSGRAVQSFLSTDPYTLPPGFDPPHERPNVAAHLGPLQNNLYPMNGFVGAIPQTVSADPDIRRLVMAHFGAEQAPINHFFATNFTICDSWFCSLPAGTQPNRLMAMGGSSMIQINQTPLPDQVLVYDWLTTHGVSWRVYHQGIPFFALMPKWIGPILVDDKFRNFSDLESDLANTPPGELPQVIFIEPTYGDAPHIGPSTDDHAPSGISDGQEFLMQVYNAVTTSPSFWRGALLIVSYDEHGGFFDHVSPPLIPTAPPQANLYPPFTSLGVRVPAYVISPFVQPGAVSHTLLDNTSILKLFAEKFDPQSSYSAAVDGRQVGSISEALQFDAPNFGFPAAPALDDYLAGHLVPPPPVTVPTPNTALQQAFQDALARMRQQGAGPDHPKFGPLIQQLNFAAAGNTTPS
jgi:phospholipase C